MSIRLLVLAVAGLLAWDLKRHYADASAEDLVWILAPTTHLVSVATGASFEWRVGEGYFSRERLFLIEKSCAGVNFMIAAFGMLVFALFHRLRDTRSAVAVLGGSLLASYAGAVCINTVRITLALWIGADRASIAAISAADMHRLEGIVVYFGGLVLIHELARSLDRRVFAPRRVS